MCRIMAKNMPPKLALLYRFGIIPHVNTIFCGVPAATLLKILAGKRPILLFSQPIGKHLFSQSPRENKKRRFSENFS